MFNNFWVKVGIKLFALCVMNIISLKFCPNYANINKKALPLMSADFLSKNPKRF